MSQTTATGRKEVNGPKIRAGLRTLRFVELAAARGDEYSWRNSMEITIMKKLFSVIALLPFFLGVHLANAQTTRLTFDNVANGTVLTNTFASSGVLFSALPPKGSTSGTATVYVVSHPQMSASSPNVLSLTNMGTNPDGMINQSIGFIMAKFTALTDFVSVDVRALALVETAADKDNKPFLMAYGWLDPKTGTNKLLDTAVYSQDLRQVDLTHPGNWETLSIRRPTRDIAFVIISAYFYPNSGPIYGVFDNLVFSSMPSSCRLTVQFAGSGAGKVTSAPAGLSATKTASAVSPPRDLGHAECRAGRGEVSRRQQDEPEHVEDDRVRYHDLRRMGGL